MASVAATTNAGVRAAGARFYFGRRRGSFFCVLQDYRDGLQQWRGYHGLRHPFCPRFDAAAQQSIM
ncbi:MAG: hypothetical protein ACLFV5_12500 [Anaerolineales bacterium]